MKKLLKNPVRKQETSRSTTEKVVRDVIFVALIAFASIMTYKVFDAEMTLTEEKMQQHSCKRRRENNTKRYVTKKKV
jgi:hypothetical protein